MKYEWKEMTHEEFQNAEQKPATIHDVVAEVDRHARITGRKEELAG